MKLIPVERLLIQFDVPRIKQPPVVSNGYTDVIQHFKAKTATHFQIKTFHAIIRIIVRNNLVGNVIKLQDMSMELADRTNAQRGSWPCESQDTETRRQVDTITEEQRNVHELLGIVGIRNHCAILQNKIAGNGLEIDPRRKADPQSDRNRIAKTGIKAPVSPIGQYIIF